MTRALSWSRPFPSRRRDTWRVNWPGVIAMLAVAWSGACVLLGIAFGAMRNGGCGCL